ncbi:MAG: MATE family efflux transporter [Notoacmeibacter sp.]
MSIQSDDTKAKFVTGSTMRHVVLMTATGSIGLIAVFLVDALNLLYISMLGKEELSASIGFASTLLFFLTSVSIGLTIGTSALVARALGRGDREAAAKAGGAALLISGLIITILTLVTLPFLSQLVTILGATGRTHELTVNYLQWVLPSSPLLAVGMGASGILRGVGDAKRAMMITLIGAIIAAILDPILIFGLGLELKGAAITTIFSRAAILIVGLYGAWFVHKLVKMDSAANVRRVALPFLRIGFPAILTQLATPVGNAYVTIEMAKFGDDAVAGWAIVGRLIPVVFGVIFALSGSIGPILGQNYGAKLYHRLYETMRDALIFTAVYTIIAWGLLALFSNQVANLFDATGLTGELVIFFCLFVAGSFLFNGALFVANAAFNNLGFPTFSTLFNWGRATLGTVPFVWAGSHYYGATGIMAGWGLGSVIFGIASILVCFKVIAGIERNANEADVVVLPEAPSTAHSPFTSGKGAL